MICIYSYTFVVLLYRIDVLEMVKLSQECTVYLSASTSTGVLSYRYLHFTSHPLAIASSFVGRITKNKNPVAISNVRILIGQESKATATSQNPSL